MLCLLLLPQFCCMPILGEIKLGMKTLPWAVKTLADPLFHYEGGRYQLLIRHLLSFLARAPHHSLSSVP